MDTAAPPATDKPARWHAMNADEALARLDSTTDGLAGSTAAQRLEKHGPNLIPKAKAEGPLRLLWRQINNPLIYVLLASGVLAVAMGKGLDGVVVLGVVVLNSLIGFLQEYRAGQAIEALGQMVPETATVLRNGEQASLPAADLVPGDVVLLQSGDKVPADMRVLRLRGLLVNEAALTGESVPAEKDIEPVEADAGLGDRSNMLFGGTLVTAGTGRGLVVATGSATELGRISSMLSQATRLETPLTRQLASVGRGITIGVVVVSGLLVLVGLGRGYSLADAMLAAITLAVAAIPEGLPAIITIALAIGVQRMARRHAIIRKLPAVETLGSTTVICTDKTGTLTRNEMTVQELWTPAGTYRLSGIGYEPHGELTRDGRVLSAPPPDVSSLLLAGVLCNDATLESEDHTCRIVGDPTEGALVVAGSKVGLLAGQVRDLHPRLDAIPFESQHQYMATLHADSTAGRMLCVKGAPEVVLRRCDRLAGAGAIDRAEIHGTIERMAADGLRVLAVASRNGGRLEKLSTEDVDGELDLLGLVAMIDPPRPEAIAAVKACHQAGIAVKMITGDHAATARAIGTQLGLPGDTAVGGRELEQAAPADFDRLAKDGHVFARVAPEHKLRLVRSLQAAGAVVAMTGDGVNDAPALKQANIGVAMGITGTAAAREAADIVLADDNFASITAAVEEGRRVYDNLLKALAFVLPTNLGEALIVLLAVSFFPLVDLGQGRLEPLLPILPVQILWINLVATVALALPLAFEAREPDIMRRPPRPPIEPVIGGFVIGRTVVVAALMTAGAVGLFWYEYSLEAPRVGRAMAAAEARTMAVTTVILFQCIYLLQCRSLHDGMLRIGLFTNRSVYLGIIALLLLQLALVYLPFMNTAFGTAALNGEAWLKSLLAAMIIIPVITVEKWWRGRRPARKSPADARDPDPGVAP